MALALELSPLIGNGHHVFTYCRMLRKSGQISPVITWRVRKQIVLDPWCINFSYLVSVKFVSNGCGYCPRVCSVGLKKANTRFGMKSVKVDVLVNNLPKECYRGTRVKFDYSVTKLIHDFGAGLIFPAIRA